MEPNDKLLLTQRHCPHCIQAAKLNIDKGVPFKLRMAFDGPQEHMSKLSDYSKEERPSMPIIVNRINNNLFFNKVPWELEEMEGYIEEFVNPTKSIAKALKEKVLVLGRRR